MLLVVTWSLLLYKISASDDTIKPRSVNIALETVLAFDKKNQAADVKFIDDVQNFLSKVKNVVEKKPARRAMNNNVHIMKFTEFIRELLELLKTYDNDDLEDVFAVIDDEIRKYHYKGCKFYELVEDPSLRRYVANKLNLVKEKPAKDIRWKLNGMLQVLEDSKFNSKQTEVLDYTNSLFTRDDGLEFKKILDNMQNYRSKYKRANLDLVKLVKESIRSVIFDKYSSLNPNTRRDFKVKLETFWNQGNRPDKYNHQVWSMNMGKENNKFLQKEFETTPFRIQDEFKGVFVLKDLATLTPHLKVKKYDYDEASDYRKEKDKHKVERNKESSSSKISDSEDHESTSEKHGVEQLSVSDNEDTISEYQPETKDTLRKIKSDEESSSSEDDQEDQLKTTSTTSTPVLEVTKKNKHHHKKTTFTTPMFINVDSDEFVRPEKIRYPSLFTNYGGKSKKKQNYQTTTSFATKRPEKSRTTKKRFKIESTTSSNDRMQTLWQEILRPKKYHYKSKKNKHETSDYAEDEDIHKGHKKSKSRNRAQKNNDKSKRIESKLDPKGKNTNSKEKYYNSLRSHHNQNDIIKLKNSKKIEHLEPKIDNEISFKLTSQKKTRPKSYKIFKQYKNTLKPLKQNIQESSTNEESDIKKQEDMASEEELYNKRPTPTLSPRQHTVKVKVSSKSKKVKIIEESTEYDSTSTESDFTSTGSDSTTNSEDEFTYEESDTSDSSTVEIIKVKKRNQKKVRRATESESDSDADAQDDSSTDKDSLDEKFDKDKIKNVTNNKQITEDVHVKYITTTLKTKTEPYEKKSSSRPIYKMIEPDKKSSTPELVRHKMVDFSTEEKLFKPKYKMNLITEDKSFSNDNSKISELSTEYEVEKILSKNLYKKRNENIQQRSKLSEEGIAIESYESKKTKFRKSNDIDNFTPTKPVVLHRIDLNYQPEETKRAQMSESKEDMDFLKRQKKRFPTLKFWEGTTRNTATYKTTTRKHTIAYTRPKKSNETLLELFSNENDTRIYLDELPFLPFKTTTPVSTTVLTTKYKSPTPLPTTVLTTKYKSPTPLPTTVLTTKYSPSEILTDSAILLRKPENIDPADLYKNYMQKYFKGNIPNMQNIHNTNLDKLDIVPLANARPTDRTWTESLQNPENAKSNNPSAFIKTNNYSLGELNWLPKELPMTSSRLSSTVQNPPTTSTKTVSNSEKDPSSLSSTVYTTPFMLATPASYPNIHDLELLLNQYGKSSMSPQYLNFLSNISMPRRNMPAENESNAESLHIETNADSLDLDNILTKYGFNDLNETVVLSKGTNSTKNQSFQGFMTNTRVPSGQVKKVRKKIKHLDEFDTSHIKDLDPNITNFDFGANFDL